LGFTVLPTLAIFLGQVMFTLRSGMNSSMMLGMICASLSLVCDISFDSGCGQRRTT
jgi:hypothetical protein